MTTTTTHYALSIESATTTTMGHEGEPETITLYELVATAPDGRRWVYIGPAPCSTRDEAMALHARIFAWEASRDDRAFDPTRKPACWLADGPAVNVAHRGGDAATAKQAKPTKPRKAVRKYSRAIGSK
jgi:hypothetical protein